MEPLGYTQIHLAEPIHKICMVADKDYAALTKLHGYEWCKDNSPGYRDTLIRVGETIRAELGPEVFIYAALRKAASCLHVVIPNVRNRAEASVLHSQGFTFFNVVRPGHDAGDCQEALDRLTDLGVACNEIVNNGDLNTWRRQALQFKPMDGHF
jgi:hypothetical protein